jgi:pimeloyl-ACP methyl ester carboxylesterase
MNATRRSALFAVLVAACSVVGCRAGGGKPLQATSTIGTVKAADGVDIRYEVGGRGEPTLVFVHGWSCDRSYWRAQVDHFAASHRVVAIDLGGHGESGLGRSDWTIASFAGDVRVVVEALGLRKVVLVGHSMGGAVVAEAARLMPDRVVAVIPVDSFVSVTPPEEKEGFIAPFRQDFRKTTEMIVRQYMFTPRSDPQRVERIVADMTAAPPAVGISAMESYLRYDEGAGLAAAKAPVRLINSDLTPTDLAAWRKHKPDVGLAVMPGVGHFLMIEDAEEFNRLLGRAVRDLTLREPR